MDSLKLLAAQKLLADQDSLPHPVSREMVDRFIIPPIREGIIDFLEKEYKGRPLVVDVEMLYLTITASHNLIGFNHLEYMIIINVLPLLLPKLMMESKLQHLKIEYISYWYPGFSMRSLYTAHVRMHLMMKETGSPPVGWIYVQYYDIINMEWRERDFRYLEHCLKQEDKEIDTSIESMIYRKVRKSLDIGDAATLRRILTIDSDHAETYMDIIVIEIALRNEFETPVSDACASIVATTTVLDRTILENQ